MFVARYLVTDMQNYKCQELTHNPKKLCQSPMNSLTVRLKVYVYIKVYNTWTSLLPRNNQFLFYFQHFYTSPPKNRHPPLTPWLIGSKCRLRSGTILSLVDRSKVPKLKFHQYSLKYCPVLSLMQSTINYDDAMENQSTIINRQLQIQKIVYHLHTPHTCPVMQSTTQLMSV